MLSLIFQTLLISSFMINGVADENLLTPKYSQDNNVIYYRFDAMDADYQAQGTLTIVTSQGSIAFEIIPNHQYIDGMHSYDVQFKVSGESIYSNMYLYDLHAWYGCGSGSTDPNRYEGNSYLPNVYFNGANKYYEDAESGYFTIQYEGSQSNPYLYIDFSIGLLPAKYFDGSQYQQGYTDGWNAGNDNGYDDGYRNGYNDGSNDAWEDASQQDETAVTIFSGILSVGLLPVNFFLAILNFEVFGINIGAFVSALLTVAIVIIVTRIVINGGNGKD